MKAFSRILLGLILGCIAGGFVAFSLGHHTTHADLAGVLTGAALFFGIALSGTSKSPEQMRLEAFKQRRL